ncbi:hypothetical protein J3E72DRAFT_401976 [Bipolaris maydis]|nr:hypothetical protein J3E72DRAFT_401976 [Bipolaris maydis]KAJ6214824.1 hypothetical protein PSV09DRAFT_2406601 [Bipolaris maydis]
MPRSVPESATHLDGKKLIKCEDSELEEGEIGHSSPSVLGDFDRMSVAPCDSALHAQLQLASYEYETLEQRYRNLVTRHEELSKLCSAYRDVICGFSTGEEQAPSIEQLRAEAGREGMRAKALEADVLKPIIREAGGLQALVSQMQSVRSLIERTGSLPELEELVSAVNLFRVGLDKVGGLQGLYGLMAEVKDLREQQLAFRETKARVDCPNGLAAKAAKYDSLMQAFSAVQATEEHTAPAGTATINPARATLIASVPLEMDPYRDLYEAPRVEKPRNKTGSNNIPLGPARAHGRTTSQIDEQPSLKREPLENMEEIISKRPRVDLERFSTQIKRSMPSFHIQKPSLHIQNSSFDRHKQPTEHEVPRSQSKPTVKPEDLYRTEIQSLRTHNQQPEISPLLAVATESINLPKSMMVGRYPIALWTGDADPHAPERPGQMKKSGAIPGELGRFLASEISKYITGAVGQLLDTMPPNRDTCILRYILDGHRPSGQPQTRKACPLCSSTWVKHHRPCALLLEVDGVRTVVFMPLPGIPGDHTYWTEKNHWVKGTE